jgi:hypothetical protein
MNNSLFCDYRVQGWLVLHFTFLQIGMTEEGRTKHYVRKVNKVEVKTIYSSMLFCLFYPTYLLDCQEFIVCSPTHQWCHSQT